MEDAVRATEGFLWMKTVRIDALVSVHVAEYVNLARYNVELRASNAWQLADAPFPQSSVNPKVFCSICIQMPYFSSTDPAANAKSNTEKVGGDPPLRLGPEIRQTLRVNPVCLNIPSHPRQSVRTLLEQSPSRGSLLELWEHIREEERTLSRRFEASSNRRKNKQTRSTWVQRPRGGEGYWVVSTGERCFQPSSAFTFEHAQAAKS